MAERSDVGNFRRFIGLEVELYLLRKRWFIALLVSLFIAYLVGGWVGVYTVNARQRGNIWDVLFSVFGNGSILFFVLHPLLLFLISDFTLESKFGEGIFLRLRSRRRWWAGKILLLAGGICLYMIITVAAAVGVSLFTLPYQNTWSEAALDNPLAFFLVPPMLGISPPLAFLGVLLLILLGWFSLGLATITFTRLFNHAPVGFLTGLLLNLAGLAAFKGYLPAWCEKFFIAHHILLNLHYGGNAAFPYSYLASIGYWILWIAFFGIAGDRLARRDFLPPKSHPDESA